MSDTPISYRRDSFTVILKVSDGTFSMETNGEHSIFDQLGIVEAARAILRMKVLNATRIASERTALKTKKTRPKTSNRREMRG